MARTEPGSEKDTPSPRREALPGPVQVGDTVTVYRLALVQCPLIEGRASILDILDPARDLCRVRFAGEAMPRVRLVHPGPWQADPDAMLRALLAHWRMSLRPVALSGFLTADIPTDGREA